MLHVTSAFKASPITGVARFSLEDVADLLRQYAGDRAAMSAFVSRLSGTDLQQIAQDIYSLTAGHKGLTGLICCWWTLELTLGLSDCTLQGWRRTSRDKLYRYIMNNLIFYSIESALKLVCSFSPDLEALTLHSDAFAEERTAQQDALQAVLLKGYYDVSPDSMHLLALLLQEGLLVTCDESGRPTTAPAPLPHMHFYQLRLVPSAPLLAGCLLSRLQLHTVTYDDSEPQQGPGLDMDWLLKQVCGHMLACMHVSIPCL